jgi:signal transduction histidine kinase
MNAPILLICSHNREWRDAVCHALDTNKYQVQAREGDPKPNDLLGVPGEHPPDVVLWRPDDGRPIEQSRYADLVRWGHGTRFVLVRFRVGRFPLLHWLRRDPRQVAQVLRFWWNRWQSESPSVRLLPPSATIPDVVKAVEQEAAACWWAKLYELDLPACRLSRSGRILRANAAMGARFGLGVQNKFWWDRVEQQKNDWLPSTHPLELTLKTKKSCHGFIESPGGQFQVVCLPDHFEKSELKTVSVLLPDTGNRSRIFQFSQRKEEWRRRTDIYDYLIQCVTGLGYQRVRLYRLSEDGSQFLPEASRGLGDRESDFKSRSLAIRDHKPSQDTLALGIPALCQWTADERDGEQVNERSPDLVRTYTSEEAGPELGFLDDVRRWVEAPLVVPGRRAADRSSVLGKLAVDRGAHGGTLSIRDALDIGCLALMGAGAIHAFNESEQARELHKQEKQLQRQREFHTDLIEVLPSFSLATDDRFYRCVGAVLSSLPGLGWQQVMLFVVDNDTLDQAVCVMALGGLEQGLHGYLESTFARLRDYTQDALQRPVPVGDHLYDAWVKRQGDHRIVSFKNPERLEGPVAEVLALQAPAYRAVEVDKDPWCRKQNQEFPGTFLGPHVHVFALTEAFFAGESSHGREARPRPVGVALLGQGTAATVPDLELTKEALATFGALIARRWTQRHIETMFASLGAMHDLKDHWKQVRDRTADLLTQRPGGTVAEPAYQAAVQRYQAAAQEMEATIRRLHSDKASYEELHRAPKPGPDEDFAPGIDFATFMDSCKRRWGKQWGGKPSAAVQQAGKSPEAILTVDVEAPEEPIRVPCDPLILFDVLTKLVRNAVQIATEKKSPTVRVHLSARPRIAGRRELIVITCEDDAGGVDRDMEELLFIYGISGRVGGGGHGLAQARAQLMRQSGDLQFVKPTEDAQGARFEILFPKEGDSRVPEASLRRHAAGGRE